MSVSFHRRGWSIAEILVVLALVATILPALTVLMVDLNRSGKKWEADLNAGASTDGALKVLARDVATARSIHVPARDTLALPGVTWHLGAGVLEREDAEGTDRWPFPAGHFEDADGPATSAARLRVGDDGLLLLSPPRARPEGGRP